MRLVISLSLFLLLQSIAVAQSWNIPQQLNNENTSVNFEVDSTWHLIKGVAKKIEGKLWLEVPDDFHSIRGEITFPVAAFDTDNENRNQKLKKVMHAEDFPNVTFELLNSIPTLCDPATLTNLQNCDFEIEGELSINNVKRNILLKSQITSFNSTYKISGSTSIKWADFNVDDPSILIAKLYDDVKIEFLVTLNSKG